MKGLGETYTDSGDGDSSHKGPGTFLLWVGGALLITAPLLAMISSADVDSVFLAQIALWVLGAILQGWGY